MFVLVFKFFVYCSAAPEALPAVKNDTTKSVDSRPQTTSGIEDLFKDSPSVTTSSTPENPQKDVKNDIMSLFEKVCAGASICLLKPEFLC